MEGINTVQELKMGPWGSFVRKVLEIMKEESSDEFKIAKTLVERLENTWKDLDEDVWR